MTFVPETFTVPAPPSTPQLLLEQLGPQHNESDLAAWGRSIAHIRSTPGYAGYDWPPAEPFTTEENLGDMHMHATDFAARTGFTYTVLDPASRKCIGCVYVYPDATGEHDAAIRSWVTVEHADLDKPLYDLVSAWLADEWPFRNVAYAAR